MLKKKAVKHTIRRPKVEHKKETKAHKEPHKELKQERYEAPKKTEVHVFKTPEILKAPEPVSRGFRGILPQRL